MLAINILQRLFIESSGNVIKVFFTQTHASVMSAVHAGLCSKS